jgi:hypothetical protein
MVIGDNSAQTLERFSKDYLYTLLNIDPNSEEGQEILDKIEDPHEEVEGYEGRFDKYTLGGMYAGRFIKSLSRKGEIVNSCRLDDIDFLAVGKAFLDDEEKFCKVNPDWLAGKSIEEHIKYSSVIAFCTNDYIYDGEWNHILNTAEDMSLQIEEDIIPKAQKLNNLLLSLPGDTLISIYECHA